jgi:hypothetical protein
MNSQTPVKKNDWDDFFVPPAPLFYVTHLRIPQTARTEQ